MAEMNFNNRVAVITGAGGGIGREYALLFAAKGASILVNDLGKTKAGENTADLVVKEITSKGGKAAANYDSVEFGEKIVDQAVKTFGRIDIIINNAGILRDISFGKMKESDWDIIMKVHLKGAFAMTRAAWPHFRNQNYGRIINTSSTSGVYGSFGQANYGTAKLGLHGLTRTLHKEGAGKNIYTNSICPSAATAMTKTVMSKELLDVIDPKNIAPFVAFLCHESTKISGRIFELGAGWISELRFLRSTGASFKLPYTIEDVQKNIDKIRDFNDAYEFPEAGGDGLRHMLDNFKRNGGSLEVDSNMRGPKEFDDGADTYLSKFNKVRDTGLGAKNVGNMLSQAQRFILEKSSKLNIEQIEKVFPNGHIPKL